MLVSDPWSYDSAGPMGQTSIVVVAENMAVKSTWNINPL